MTVAMSPLWVKHPDIPWSSVGWRMGWGEAYWGQWRIFFLALKEQERQRYRETWPEPESWRGLYAFIESGEPPLGQSNTAANWLGRIPYRVPKSPASASTTGLYGWSGAT